MFTSHPKPKHLIFSTKNNHTTCSIDPKNSINNGCIPKPKGKQPCPECGKESKRVLGKTVQHLLKEHAKKLLSSFEGFYYCTTPECNVVYFRDKAFFTQADLMIIVGQKKGAVPATLCYCFEWTKEMIHTQIQNKGESNALVDIKNKMQTLGCNCTLRNPSGGCCLGDVGKAINDIKETNTLSTPSA